MNERRLQRLLDESIAEHGAPGGVIGVLADGESTVVASGVSRLPDGPPVTSETLFLIASITKVWTATMVMQLVDAGELELEAPASRYLDPPLRLVDQEVADTVTVQHLLTHSGGFYGDAEEPPERGDDAVRRTVDGYAGLRQLHRPGTLFSYSNAGYNVLGRIVECLTGATWDRALRERLLDPLELRRTFTFPEHAMVHPHAVGHEPQDPHSLVLAPVSRWLDERGGGPCGGTLCTTASDLLAFAGLHLHDGAGPGGRRMLSPESARAMRRPRVTQPDPSMAPHWGLGWAIERESAPLVVGHGGNTCGQQSELVLLPELGAAVCVLVNGDVQELVRIRVLATLLRELAQTELSRTPAPAPPGDAPDLKRFAGSFDAGEEMRIDVTAAGGELRTTFVTSGDTARRLPGFTAPLTFAGGTTFLLTRPTMTVPTPVTFLSEDGADAVTHLALGLRVAPRR